MLASYHNKWSSSCNPQLLFSACQLFQPCSDSMSALGLDFGGVECLTWKLGPPLPYKDLEFLGLQNCYNGHVHCVVVRSFKHARNELDWLMKLCGFKLWIYRLIGGHHSQFSPWTNKYNKVRWTLWKSKTTMEHQNHHLYSIEVINPFIYTGAIYTKATRSLRERESILSPGLIHLYPLIHQYQ